MCLSVAFTAVWACLSRSDCARQLHNHDTVCRDSRLHDVTLLEAAQTGLSPDVVVHQHLAEAFSHKRCQRALVPARRACIAFKIISMAHEGMWL